MIREVAVALRQVVSEEIVQFSKPGAGYAATMTKHAA